MTITLQIPTNIEESLAREWPDVSAKAMEALAIEGYRDGVLSRGQVSEMLGLDVWGTEALLKNREAYLHYDLQDLDADRRANEGLSKP